MRTTVGVCEDAARAVLETCGMPRENARISARAIVLAEVWGVASHGLLRLPHYVRRLRAGGYNARALLRVVADRGAVVSYDGEGGLGHWQAWRAAKKGVERARRHGVGVTAVGNSGHCGALGIYTLPAIRAEMLSIVLSNGPAVMPAWGGSTPLLSTSPLAVGIAQGEQRLMVDMATSSVARGKIAAYAARGEPLPEGWALSGQGEPTTDAQAALSGMLAPMGGAKGFALALVVEALTGGLVGPNRSTEVADMFDPSDDARPQGLSHTVVTIDPGSLDVDGRASSRLDALFGAVEKTGGHLPGSGRRDPDTVSSAEEIEVDDALAADVLGL